MSLLLYTNDETGLKKVFQDDKKGLAEAEALLRTEAKGLITADGKRLCYSESDLRIERMRHGQTDEHWERVMDMDTLCEEITANDSDDEC